VFDVAAQVLSWLEDGHRVTTARVVDTAGLSSWDPGAAVAWTAGQPVAGSLFDGAAADAVAAALAASVGQPARVLRITVSAEQAAAAGLACGGTARIIVQDAADVSRADWQALAQRRPRCIVTEAGASGRTAVFGPADSNGPSVDPLVRRLFARGATGTRAIEVDGHELVVTALWPVPSLLIVGDGLIATALADVAALLGWQCATSNDPTGAADLAARLGAGDCFVVLSHDIDVAGPALLGALSGGASYVGALGSRRTQGNRADWLTARGITSEQIAGIHGPAGLDIGALTPHEIAVAIAAEMLAVRTGNDARPLQGRLGSIHPSGVQAPPPRYPAY
jgi:xanthine dehydrogenase accessory factor